MLTDLEKEAVQSVTIDLEKTPEFESWKAAKLEECVRYLKLSFGLEMPVEKLVFHLVHLGYPDPIGQLRTHARIWGYNYKIDEEIVINPATNQPMSYVVWQALDIPVVSNPSLESDEDTSDADFDTESTGAA